MLPVSSLRVADLDLGGFRVCQRDAGQVLDGAQWQRCHVSLAVCSIRVRCHAHYYPLFCADVVCCVSRLACEGAKSACAIVFLQLQCHQLQLSIVVHAIDTTKGWCSEMHAGGHMLHVVLEHTRRVATLGIGI